QNRRCLNGSDAALDTKAIRQKRGRHRAEKIALTQQKAPETSPGLSPTSRLAQASYVRVRIRIMKLSKLSSAICIQASDSLLNLYSHRCHAPA
ncbi:hypothetical protein, partial [Bradyrhizobium sp. CW11]|uniref:hypothetical protein n=1 Tax=Bradyrhizobium sp. CW11 TaxID=2782684 RepID=UPI001FF853EE